MVVHRSVTQGCLKSDLPSCLGYVFQLYIELLTDVCYKFITPYGSMML